MKKIIKSEILDGITTILASPKSITTIWLERLYFEGGGSEIILREKAEFGCPSHKGLYQLSDGGKRH